jgi:hypothetical protein
MATTRSARGRIPFVVRGHHDDVSLVREGPKQSEHPFHLDVVEMGGGLVGQEQGRVVGEGPGDGQALLLATGEVAGPEPHPVGQGHLLEQGLGPFPRRLGPGSRGPEGDLHVLQGGQAGDQVEGLEHDADPVPGPG